MKLFYEALFFRSFEWNELRSWFLEKAFEIESVASHLAALYVPEKAGFIRCRSKVMRERNKDLIAFSFSISIWNSKFRRKKKQKTKNPKTLVNKHIGFEISK